MTHNPNLCVYICSNLSKLKKILNAQSYRLAVASSFLPEFKIITNDP